MKKYGFTLLLIGALSVGCDNSSDTANQPIKKDLLANRSALTDFTTDPSQFNDYWYAGKAEITTYSLSQARYGEMREGTATMIYVTEPFSKSKQVKLDYADRAGDDKVDVLKLNFTKKFVTGIYPYSLMSSIFTPVNGEMGSAVKSATSSQEWCGHTFTQLNKYGDGYQFQEYSYFESEGDQNRRLKDAILEDEVWAQIRLNPENLPTGDIELVPSSLFLRFMHKETKAYNAKATLTSEKGYQVYRLEYPELNRKLAIHFTAQFPHVIDMWTETYQDGFGNSGEELTTKGELMKRIQSDYWNKNSNADQILREKIGLEP